jgi:hypothetical protein
LNTQAAIEEFLDASFSVRSVSYQRKEQLCWRGPAAIYCYVVLVLPRTSCYNIRMCWWFRAQKLMFAFGQVWVFVCSWLLNMLIFFYSDNEVQELQCW